VASNGSPRSEVVGALTAALPLVLRSDCAREAKGKPDQQATGREVIGFMSGKQQDPDMMCEVFILAPTDLVCSEEVYASGQPPSI
jgi:hypothetical protein